MSIGRFLDHGLASTGSSLGQSLSDQFHEKLQTRRNFFRSDTRLNCCEAANRQASASHQEARTADSNACPGCVAFGSRLRSSAPTGATRTRGSRGLRPHRVHGAGPLRSGAAPGPTSSQTGHL